MRGRGQAAMSKSVGSIGGIKGTICLDFKLLSTSFPLKKTIHIR